MKYFKIQMDPSQLAMMFTGFQRKLFTSPGEGDIYSVNLSNGDCVIYFKPLFHSQYEKELESARNMGKFQNSNAKGRWMNLLSMVSSAVLDELPSNADDYYTATKMFL